MNTRDAIHHIFIALSSFFAGANLVDYYYNGQPINLIVSIGCIGATVLLIT